MRIAVAGASGFIGRRFTEIYKDSFEEVVELNSKNAPLHDYKKLKEVSENIDVFIHVAFDHNYKENITGIKNILQVCKENNIKKLIYLSTVSVYDPDIKGILDENSPYSDLNDPYSKEKRKIEKIIDNFKEKSFDIIVLQPSIVYGLGGNWTKYAFHVCKSKKTLLPSGGETKANVVYVDDVVNAIYKSIGSHIKYEKILISGDTISWREFYSRQCESLKELGLPSHCNIQNDNSKNEFHSNNLINFIFTLWFKTLFGNVFDLMIGVLKKLRAKSYSDVSSNIALKNFLKSNIGKSVLVLTGITKKVHSSQFTINTSKAKKLLNYTPNYSFDKGIEIIQKNIYEIIR